MRQDLLINLFQADSAIQPLASGVFFHSFVLPSKLNLFECYLNSKVCSTIIAGPPSKQTPKVRSRIFKKQHTETGKRNPGQVYS